jgi:hypothetical protein
MLSKEQGRPLQDPPIGRLIREVVDTYELPMDDLKYRLGTDGCSPSAASLALWRRWHIKIWGEICRGYKEFLDSYPVLEEEPLRGQSGTEKPTSRK